MTTPIDALDAAIREVTNARALISRVRSSQVRGTDQLAALKSMSYAWFNAHRQAVSAFAADHLPAIDDEYRRILVATDKSAARSTYLGALTRAKTALVDLRAFLLTEPGIRSVGGSSDDATPDFSPLAGSKEMCDVLNRRWLECIKCVSAEAHLAAIVMMGGLLEALFVARANLMINKDPLVKAAAAPKDKKSGKTLNIEEWMLDSYIKVGRELNWITDSAKQVADILKEFRNYVHPAKELRHGVNLAENDSAMFWNVTKALVRQLLLSASRP
ncbi:MAG: hypothetical protein WC670_11895 [Pseudolabrys sp.]|jgi:hypothetical protein